MEISTVLIIIFGLIIFSGLIILFFVNNLLLKREKVEFQFKSVIKYLSDRVDLLDRISSFVEENTKNEEKYITNLNSTSTNLTKIDKINKDNLKEIKTSLKLLQKFTKLTDIYPNLNKNEIYKVLVDKINLNEDRINYSIESYNKEVKIYNELKQTKINSFISKIFKISDYEYYTK